MPTFKKLKLLTFLAQSFFLLTSCTQTCPEKHYGENCQPCNCQHGQCYDGLNGDGSCKCDEHWTGKYCDDCSSDFFGENCNQIKTCQNGIASIGINGNGHCHECINGFWGLDCENTITCKNGLANDGPEGDGHCLECRSIYWGPDCENEAYCQHGIINNGIAGDGACKNCNDGWSGDYCDTCIKDHYGSNCTPCNCKDYEICLDGHNGSGKCECKNSLMTGPNCDQCKNSLMTGPNCDQCKNKNMTWPECNICMSGYGKDCKEYGFVTDTRDNNVYKTVLINGLEWMAENYRRQIGTYYQKSSDDDAIYGLLYDWETATSADFCPTDWRLPTKDDFDNLLTYVADNSTIKDNFLTLIAKSKHWCSYENLGLDEFGFGGLPAGYYYNKYYNDICNDGYYWSTTEATDDSSLAYSLHLRHKATNIKQEKKVSGRSVRCVRDYCNHGRADNNSLMKKCSACNDGWAGEYCNIPNTCQNGTPNLGINGDGKCKPNSCINSSGENCEICDNPFYGTKCDKIYGSVTNNSNHTYKTVIIGKQEWMAEDYSSTQVSGRIGNYGESFYDWETATSADFCPSGWRLPSNKDFSNLLTYVTNNRSSKNDFLALIAKSKEWLEYPNQGGDDFGFGGRPSGHYSFGNRGAGYFGQWWSSTEYYNSKGYYLAVNRGKVYIGATDTPSYLPVRCLRDAN